LKKLLALCLAAVFLIPTAIAADSGGPMAVFPHQSETAVDVEAKVAEMAELHAWLSSHELGTKAVLDVEIPFERIASLKAQQPATGPLLIGVQGDVDFAFDPTAQSRVGAAFFADDTMIWNGTFRSTGASGVRLHLQGVDLPAGAELYVFGRHGHAFGPYTGQHEDLWTHTVAGEEAVLQLRLPAEAAGLGNDLFRVSQLSHLGENYEFGARPDTKAFCPWNDTCIINAECATIPPAVQPLQEATAYLLYTVGPSTFLCTGGLLNDTASSGTPYLLTANHCFDTQASATSLEAYFQWTVPCGASCGGQFFPPGSVPRVLGSTLLATNPSSDFTFVELSAAAPAGSVFLGWTTTPVAFSAGTLLYRISHPAGSPQAYSEHVVNTTSGTCSGIPRGPFIYSDATLGDTEGGSSGSVVVNSSNQVVGQLLGACGATPGTTCDGDDRTVDGAFATTYPSVEQWLDPPPTQPCTGTNVYQSGVRAGGPDFTTSPCRARGNFQGDLVCQVGAANLELHLDKYSCGWVSCSFSAVASSVAAPCDKSLTYTGTKGRYRWRVSNPLGPDEKFTLCTNKC